MIRSIGWIRLNRAPAAAAAASLLLAGASRAHAQTVATVPRPSGTVALARQVDSLDAAGQWRDALPTLEQLARATPDDAVRQAQLGRWLSWKGDRARALAWLARAAALAPRDADVLTDYGTVLSWGAATRDSALRVLDRALAAAPSHRDARAARADVLRWRGDVRQALDEYERVLAAERSHVAALRGAAAVRTQWRDGASAAALLDRLPSWAASEPGVRVERARVAALRQDVAGADSLLRDVRDLRAYGAVPLADSVRALARPSVAVWGHAHRRANQLDDAAPSVEARVPLGRRVRATATYAPARYDAGGGEFTVQGGSAAVDADLGTRVHARAAAGARTHVGALGELTLGMRLSPGWRAEISARRDPMEEFESSVRPVPTPYGMVGPVRLTSGRATVAWSGARLGADAWAAVGGVVTGDGLVDNTRRAADVQLGKTLHAGGPYVRLAYGASWMSFDYDASRAPGVAAPATAGGYFSPDRYLYQYANLSLSDDRGGALAWRASGAAGVQAVRPFVGEVDRRGAWQASGELRWRVVPTARVVLGVEALDVYGAYRRQGARLGVIHSW